MPYLHDLSAAYHNLHFDNSYSKMLYFCYTLLIIVAASYSNLSDISLLKDINHVERKRGSC